MGSVTPSLFVLHNCPEPLIYTARRLGHRTDSLCVVSVREEDNPPELVDPIDSARCWCVCQAEF